MKQRQAPKRHMLDKLLVFREEREETLTNNARLAPSELFPVLLSLVSVTSAITLFHIEQGLDLPRLMWIATAGFLVYSQVPLQGRLPFFLALNFTALALLSGLVPALIILCTGLTLIGMASLQIRHLYRIALVLLPCAGLVAVKAGIPGGATGYHVATVLGGLFMFRLILYLYEIPHEKAPVSVWKRISYFFLLPNLVFLIFPIVDYKTFVRGFYSRPALETCRKGMYWIFIGFIHLLIYRLIYSYAIPLPDEIDGIFPLIQYMVFSYMLIIRLSGIFHLSVGIICLFGFDLPRSFNNYFLSSSFSDLWHRINSYWRGFVMKVFYFPLFMRFKKRGALAVFITVILVFIANFLLHAYQWFWIRGRFFVSETDVVFWGVLGLLLACNSVVSLKRKRVAPGAEFSWHSALLLSLKILGMFMFMCIMWSIWISNSLESWWRLVQRGAVADLHDLMACLAALVTIIVLGTAIQYIVAKRAGNARPGQTAQTGRLAPITIVSALMCVLASPQVSRAIENRWSIDLSPVLTEQLNDADSELLRKGYYEELIIGNTLSTRIWEVREYEKLAEQGQEPPEKSSGSNVQQVAEDRMGKQADEAGNPGDEQEGAAPAAALPRAEPLPVADTRSIREPAPGIMLERLVPNIRVVFHGAEFSTNEYGMRDRHYTREKPPNTYRIAQLGASPQMGSGVEDNETAENLVEDRLNATGGWGPYQAVEILNFAASNYALVNHVGVTDQVLGQFDPDMILLYLHTVREDRRNADKIAEAMVKNVVGAYPVLETLRIKLGIGPQTSIEDAAASLLPYQMELFDWGLDWMRDYCSDRGIALVVAIQGIPSARKRATEKNLLRLSRVINKKGIPLIDLTGAWEGYDAEMLKVSRFDRHPNAKGQQLLADKLLQGLRRLQPVLVGGAATTAEQP